jgi:pyridoxal phosphate enzyme (YggS family)
MTTIAQRWAEVDDRIEAAAQRSGRDRDDVRVVAATKTVPLAPIRELLAAGCTDLGENRAQELLAKAPDLADDPGITWHFIGPVQRNKVNGLAPWVTWWHTVDRPALVTALGTRVPGASVLLEVNVAGEPQKAGCDPESVGRLAESARAAGLDVLGLMAIPPHPGDPRRWFAALADLAARLGLPELSMGMSDDYEVAIEEGATIVRLGRVLFGPRV